MLKNILYRMFRSDGIGPCHRIPWFAAFPTENRIHFSGKCSIAEAVFLDAHNKKGPGTGAFFMGGEGSQPRVRARTMKLSKFNSATCHQRYWSLRKVR